MVPKRFAQARVNDFESWDELCAVMAAGPRNLLLHGPNRKGKSHAAAACCYEWMRSSRTLWVFTSRILSRIADAFKSGKIDETLREYEEAEVLVLDDFGAQRLTEHTIEMLTRIVLTRADYDRPTVITSNLSPDAIQGSYGNRIASRIYDEYRLIDFSAQPTRSKGISADEAVDKPSAVVASPQQNRMNAITRWWYELPRDAREQLIWKLWPNTAYRKGACNEHELLSDVPDHLPRVWIDADGEIQLDHRARPLFALWDFAQNNVRPDAPQPKQAKREDRKPKTIGEMIARGGK